MEIPQQLSRQAIQEFKANYEEEFGDRLSDDEAQEMGIRLLGLFDILLRSTPVEPSEPQGHRVPPR